MVEHTDARLWLSYVHIAGFCVKIQDAVEFGKFFIFLIKNPPKNKTEHKTAWLPGHFQRPETSN